MVSEFERRAWDNRTDAEQHKPEMAAKIALDDLERGVIKPLHMIVAFVELKDGYQVTSFYQAGELSTYAVEGALARCIRASQGG